LVFFFTGDFTEGGGIFWLCDAGGEGGGDRLGGDGDGDIAVSWNTSSSSRAL
jgi:hypothetical protein